MSYFPRPPSSGCSDHEVTVTLDLQGYATKDELKSATGVDTSAFVKNKDFDDLKKKVNNISGSTTGKVDPAFKKDLEDIKT